MSSLPLPFPSQLSPSKKSSSKPLGVGGSAGSHPQRAPGCNLVTARKMWQEGPFPEQPWKGCRAQKHGLSVTCIATPDPTPQRAGLCLEEPLAGKFSAAWTTFPKLKPLSSSSSVSSLSFLSPKDDCLQMLQDHRVETQLPFPPPAGASSFLVLVRGLDTKLLRLSQLAVWYSSLFRCANLRRPSIPSSTVTFLSHSIFSKATSPEAEGDVATISPFILRTFCQH